MPRERPAGTRRKTDIDLKLTHTVKIDLKLTSGRSTDVNCRSMFTVCVNCMSIVRQFYVDFQPAGPSKLTSLQSHFRTEPALSKQESPMSSNLCTPRCPQVELVDFVDFDFGVATCCSPSACRLPRRVGYGAESRARSATELKVQGSFQRTPADEARNSDLRAGSEETTHERSKTRKIHE